MQMETSTVIHMENLTKVYPLPGRKGKRVAVDGLSLDVKEGQVFAFLGPNGAGKTTTIKMLLGFTFPTAGRAEIFGRDVSDERVRGEVGYLPEQPYFHKFLTPRETLSLHAALLGLGRKESREQIASVLSLAGLDDHHQVRLSRLSKGLMQRVGIAQAMLGDPRLLILDEPTSGLDPIGRREMKDLIASLKSAGKTIFLSSHLLSEVEAVCDHVAILSRGTLVCVGTPEQIKRRGGSTDICCAGMTAEAEAVLWELGATVERVNSEDSSENRRAVARVASERVFEALRAIEAHNISLLSVTPEQETLEDAFVRLAA